MNDETSGGTLPPADKLLDTLQSEHEQLQELDAQFEQQLEALRDQQVEQMEEATAHANETMRELNRLQQARRRQMRLLGRFLDQGEDASLEQLGTVLKNKHPELGEQLLTRRQSLREQAEATKERCEELEFALQYAVKLRREMLDMLQHLDAAPSASEYTASGTTADPPRSRSLLNEVG